MEVLVFVLEVEVVAQIMVEVEVMDEEEVTDIHNVNFHIFVIDSFYFIFLTFLKFLT